MLPLCFGEATKFSADLLDADKTYEAEICLGVTTDSGDAEGLVIATAPVAVTAADVARVLPAFLGDIQQVPPMHSALKRDGKPLYELARQGIVVERAARAVTIHGIDVLGFAGNRLRLSVQCSKGTYIRVLAADIGAALGCGGHLTALRRTWVGALDLRAAVTLETLTETGEDERARFLLPLDALLQNLPRIDLDADSARRFSHGNPVDLPPGWSGKIRVYADGQLLGVGEPGAGERLWPKRLLQLAG